MGKRGITTSLSVWGFELSVYLSPMPVPLLLILLTTTTAPARFELPPSAFAVEPHHTHHVDNFAKYAPTPINAAVLRAVDTVQSHAPDGGGYFVGVHATPAESPIGYPLSLLGESLLSPPRTTSYCSGSSYTAFIETLNILFKDSDKKPSPDRVESLRMQEPDGSRREDFVKFWGNWNADGPGTQFALVQYSHMGDEISPADARPGDFANISWTSGLGHSVVFLGFYNDPKTHEQRILYWSSQKGTNGLGDQSSPLSKVKSVKFVRLTHPERLFTFDPTSKVTQKVPEDRLTR
jgi:hypothetical protein